MSKDLQRLISELKDLRKAITYNYVCLADTRAIITRLIKEYGKN